MHLLRWGLITNPSISQEDHITPLEFLSLPLGLYLSWQLSYCLITEVPLRSKLASDPDLITSLRYLAKDRKNGFRNLCLSVLCWLGLSQPGEDLDPDSIKAKLTFSVTQLVYTLITIIPTPFLYTSYSASCIYLMLLYSFGTWNGASYYIEVGFILSCFDITQSCQVFAERYHLKFHQKSNSETDATEKNEAETTNDHEDASENLEIDQSCELYKTIVAAIIEDNDTSENSDVMDWAMDDKTESSDTKDLSADGYEEE